MARRSPEEGDACCRFLVDGPTVESIDGGGRDGRDRWASRVGCRGSPPVGSSADGVNLDVSHYSRPTWCLARLMTLIANCRGSTSCDRPNWSSAEWTRSTRGSGQLWTGRGCIALD